MEHHHHHDHEHPHEHDEGHVHRPTEKETIVQQRLQALERFTSRHGRAPTEDESLQILSHGHLHDHLEVGTFETRFQSDSQKYISLSTARNYTERAFTIGIGGPVGSGKTALMLKLCQNLRNQYNLAAITNDIFTQEDGEFLLKHEALPAERIRAIETGGCPHAAIREDISANLQACEDLTRAFHPDFVLIESGGDNLAANYSRELADFIIYVIDVAGGDKVPRKGGPGITQADLLIINKTDLAAAVGADLDIMARDALKMRGPSAPTVFTVMKDNHCAGVQKVMKILLRAWACATSVDESSSLS